MRANKEKVRRVLNVLKRKTFLNLQLADQDAWNATNITLGSYDQANEECSDTDTNTDPVDPNATENTAEDEREEEPLNAGISESISISDNDITIRLSLGEGRTLISVLKD